MNETIISNPNDHTGGNFTVSGQGQLNTVFGVAPSPIPGATPTADQLAFRAQVARHEAEYGVAPSGTHEPLAPLPSPAPGSEPSAERRRLDAAIAGYHQDLRIRF